MDSGHIPSPGSGPTLLLFPGARVLDAREAAIRCGITPFQLRCFARLRWGLRPIPAKGAPRYRVEDVDAFRAALLRDMGLDPGATRLLPAPEGAGHVLLRHLAGRKIASRLILLTLWGMFAVGAAMTLLLFGTP